MDREIPFAARGTAVRTGSACLRPSKHFGFMRATLRVLYNLNEMTDDSAYIVVGDTTNRWRDNKLFIFDDTLLHESINQTDQARYCLFVDMIRPTPFPAFNARDRLRHSLAHRKL